MTKKFIKKHGLIILILLVGTVLRFYQATSVPPSLNWDEVSHGYNAYSILSTGKDEWGEKLPAIFRAYGDYKLPVYIYSTVLSIAAFGLNPLSIRLVSILSGIAVIYFTYKLCEELFRGSKNVKYLSLTASFLIAVEPWSLFLSRGAFEANQSLALIISGFYFLLIGLRKYNNLIVGSTLLGLSVWTYNTARVYVPIMLLAFLIIYFRDIKNIWFKNRKSILLSGFIMGVFLIPMFVQLLNPEGSARFGWVSIFDQSLINKINESRGSVSINPTLERLIYNKLTFGIPVVAGNWLSHYTPSFLFLKGGSHFQFSVPDRGILYQINLLFFYLGILISFFAVLKSDHGKKRCYRRRSVVFVLTWLLVGAIASSITREAPHVLRSITILPIPMIMSSIGVVWFSEKFNKANKSILMIYAIVVLILAANYLSGYFQEYRRDYSWSWQYGNKQMVDYVRENYDKYAKIIITKKYGEPHEFLLFHWPWEPDKYLEDETKIRYFQTNWYWVDKFDKFYFVNDWEVVGTDQNPRSPTRFILESRAEDVDCAQIKCLLATSPGNVPVGWELLETIKLLDDQPVYEIYEN